MKVLVFGAGGIGSVLGGFLARMGHPVALLGRAWHLDVIEKEGLLITGLWGQYRIKAFDLYRSADEIKKQNTSFDLILLTVKSFDTKRAVEELRPLMKKETTLLSFQNGLGNIETVLEKIPAEQYLIGRAIFGVETKPGAAKVTVQADALAIGALPGVAPPLSPEKIAREFQLAKIDAKAVPDIMTSVWAKVIYNCALNGICTYHEMPYGGILKNPETKKAMEEIVRECYDVGLKKGIPLKPATAQEYIDLLTAKLIPTTASHYPSMLQDLKRGKPIEIEALNGAICRLGEAVGVPTPQNQQVVQNLLQKASSGA